MTIPDYAALTLSQIAAHLGGLAFVVFVTGVAKAMTTSTVLWTYLAGWIREWLTPALVLVAWAAVGKGFPGILERNDLIAALFVPAALAFVASSLAAIAKNAGLDLRALPFARNVTPTMIAQGKPAGPTPPVA